jgi:hypothetical protein
MSEFLPRCVRILSLCVFLAGMFAMGVVVASVGRWGQYGVGIGALVVLFSSLYATALYGYVAWRFFKKRHAG